MGTENRSPEACLRARKHLSLFLACLLLSSTAMAASPKNPGPAKAASRPSPGPREELLPNGLRIGALKGGKREGEAALVLSMRVGSYAEAEGEAGFAHLVEHIAFEGGEGAEALAFREELKKSSAFSASNAWTSFYHTVYVFPFDPAKREARAFILGLLADILGSAEISPGALERARAIVQRELAEDEDYDEKLPEDEPLGSLGSRKSIAEASVAALAKFKTSWYRTELSAVYIAGDIEVEESFGALKSALSKLQRKPGQRDPEIYARRSGIEREGGEEREPQAYVERDWGGGNFIQLAFPLDTARDRDEKTLAVEGLAVRLLDARLAKGLGRSRASAWKPKAWVDQKGLFFEVHSTPGGEEELVTGLGSELQFALRGFGAKESAEALDDYRADIDRAFEAQARYSAYDLALELAYRFGNEGTPFAHPNEAKLRLALEEPRLEAKALEFLKSCLDLEGLVFDVVQFPKSAAALGKAWASRRARPVKAPAPPRLPGLPSPLPPLESWDDPRSGARFLRLANGSLVALFPARSGEEELSLWALSPGGYLSKPERDPILQRLSDEAPSFFGIPSLPGSAFARELGARGAELWFGLSARHEEIEGRAPAEELEAYLRLLHGVLQGSAPAERAGFAAMLSTFDNQADSYDLIIGSSSADRYGPDPAFAILGGKAASLVDPELLPASFLEHFGEPEDFIWFLAGLPDLDKAELLVAAALGSIPPRPGTGSFPNRPLPQRRGILDRSTEDLYSDRKSVDFRAELPLGPLEGPGEALAIRVLVDAFHSDLYEALRERELAVYSLKAELWEPSVAEGGNAIYLCFSCEGKAAERIAGVLREEARRLAAGESSEASLAEAVHAARLSFAETPDLFEPWLEALAAEAPGFGQGGGGLASLGKSLEAAHEALEPEALRALAKRLVRGEELFLRISK